MTKDTCNLKIEALLQSKRRTDASFRSCAFTMLVFIILCIILLVLTWVFKRNQSMPMTFSDDWRDDPLETSTSSMKEISSEGTRFPTLSVKIITTESFGTVDSVTRFKLRGRRESGLVESTAPVSTEKHTTEFPREYRTTAAETTCSDPECKRLARRMLVQMDHESDPCSNFYMYACGGLQDPLINEVNYNWKAWNRIAEQRTRGEDIFTKYNAFYNSCVQETENATEIWRDEVLKILTEAGMTNVTEIGYKVDFTKLFIILIKYNSPQVFDIVLDVDDSSSLRYVLKMNVPMDSNPFVFHPSNTPVELDLTSEINLSQHYVKHKTDTKSDFLNRAVPGIRDILTTLNSSDSFSITPLDTLHLAYYMDKFSSEIVKVIPDASKLIYETLSKQYTVVTVDELQRKYSLVKWKELLKELLGREVSGDTHVQLYFEKYFNEIFAIIQNEQSEAFQAIITILILVVIILQYDWITFIMIPAWVSKIVERHLLLQE